MNQSESERLASALSKLGYKEAPSAESADIVFINSCVVREHAENKVVNKLHALRGLKRKNPEAVITLTGCMVDANTTGLKKKFPHVDHFLKPGEYPYFLPEVAERLPDKPAVSTYVPIIQGCDNFCSYCIVPYRRGREKSRAVSEISCEVRELVKRGTKEVILLGKNVDSYGHDLPGKPDLADLLVELDKIDGLVCIRFLTNHPKDMSLKLVETMAKLDKVCKQLSLPVQAGSNKILEAMRRGYTAEDYRKLVETLRSYIPDISLSTDVIVGFPGETEEDFSETVKLLSDVRFDQVHVAAYSPRSGTLAAKELIDDIASEVKKARLQQIETMQGNIATEINAGLSGKTLPVLVEDKKGNRYFGRTESDKLVFFPSKKDIIGELVNAKITRTSPWSLVGEIV